ncbi:hypothetical protein KFL_000990010, partial [Klebsormidium nitens]
NLLRPYSPRDYPSLHRFPNRRPDRSNRADAGSYDARFKHARCYDSRPDHSNRAGAGSYDAHSEHAWCHSGLDDAIHGPRTYGSRA